MQVMPDGVKRVRLEWDHTAVQPDLCWLGQATMPSPHQWIGSGGWLLQHISALRKAITRARSVGLQASHKSMQSMAGRGAGTWTR